MGMTAVTDTAVDDSAVGDTALDSPVSGSAVSGSAVSDSVRTTGKRSAAAKDWFEYLGLDGYCCSFVRVIDERDSLLRLGIKPDSIGAMTRHEMVTSFIEEPPTKRVFAIRLGDWTMLVEYNGVQGLEKVLALSAGTEVIATHKGLGAGRSFRYVRDGVVLTAFDDSEFGHLVSWGREPDLLTPFVEQLKLSEFQDFDEDGVTPDLELACLVAGIKPQPEDFRGPLLCAVAE